MNTPDPSDYNAQVLARFEGDKELLREVAQLFLEDSAQSLEAVRAAVAGRDCAAIHRAAHTLKGSISNFLAADEHTADDPARRAAAAAQALERQGASGRLDQVDEAFAAVVATLGQLRLRLEALIAG